MKMPRPKGSFGIPPEIHPDHMKKQREELEAREAERPERYADSEFDPAVMAQGAPEETAPEASAQQTQAQESEPSEEAKHAAEAAKNSDPVAILKRLGIELTEEDCSRLLFKGFVEKDIKICYDPLKKRDFTGTFKTLTGREYDQVDELLAEEISKNPMTVNGKDSRHSTWLLSFALTSINGMALQKPIFEKDGTVDTKKTAAERIKVVRALSPFVLDKASRIYAAFTVAIQLILEDPEKVYLKKP